MCIFSGNIGPVHGTNIFVGLTTKNNKKDNWQLTVYSNIVAIGGYGGKPSAMILPFPTSDAHDSAKKNYTTIDSNSDIIQFLDMKKFEKESGAPFFDQINPWKDEKRGRSMKSMQSLQLQVKEIGGYNVSVARNIKYLRHIDKTSFQFDPVVIKLLKEKYNENYGFIICQFIENIEKNVSPIGYIHPCIDSYFIPCYHLHGGDTDEIPHDWDHKIYIANPKHGSIGGRVANPPLSKNSVKLLEKQTKSKLVFDVLEMVRIEGSLENQDFIVEFEK